MQDTSLKDGETFLSSEINSQTIPTKKLNLHKLFFFIVLPLSIVLILIFVAPSLFQSVLQFKNTIKTNDISISLNIPLTVKKGSPINIEWEVFGAPTGSSIGFSIMPNVSKPADIDGPMVFLTISSIDLNKSSTGIFNWDGKSFGWAPDDLPILRKEALEPGEYIVFATIYDKNTLLVPVFGAPTKSKPHVIAKANSKPFTITGAFNLANLQWRLESAAAKKFQEIINFDYDTPYDKKNIKIIKPLADSGANNVYCMTFEFMEPANGKITACGHPKFRDKDPYMTTTGGITTKAGVLPFEDALKKAHAVADAPYLAKSRFNHEPTADDLGDLIKDLENIDPGSDEYYERTKNIDLSYLVTELDKWAYSDDGGYWLFYIKEEILGVNNSQTGADEEILDGDSSQTSADYVLTRVDNNEQACVIKTDSYHDKKINLKDSNFSCQ